MPIQFACPNCRKAVRVPDTAAGKNAKCPHCAAVIAVPASSPPAPARAAPAAAAAQQQQFSCPTCGRTMRAPKSAGGKQAKCPACATVVVVPGGPPQPRPTAQPRPAPQSNPAPMPQQSFGGFPSVPNPAPMPPRPGGPAYPQNPYASSQMARPGAPAGSGASGLAMPPAVCLLIVTILYIIYLMVMLVWSVIAFAAGEPPPNLDPEIAAQFDMGMKMGFAFQMLCYLVFFAVQGLICWGCISMIQLKGRSLAMTAMILSVIPCCCSPGFVVGIPFGIWGLIVLNNQTVMRSMK